VIYRANAEQIRDPDLIYPGQVFSLPPAKAGKQP
jgi:nucleoid-associated protein YgaU